MSPRRSWASLLDRVSEHKGTPAYRAGQFTLAIALLAASLALASIAARPARPRMAAVPAPARAAAPRPKVLVTPLPVPTPIFATYRSLPLYLPLKPKTITLIAFHQASSGTHAVLHMTSLVSTPRGAPSSSPGATASPSSAGTLPPSLADEAAEISSAEERSVPAIYSGRVLRLWRSGRTGPPDTAADVGAKPGTQVFAPVSGTVLAVKRYKLYGEYDDYEIHIRAKGWDSVDAVLLHVESPVVTAGQQVVAGETPLAKVRWLSRLFTPQLDEYTHDGGNHVHLQLNQIPPSGKVPFIGQVQEERPGRAGLPSPTADPRRVE